MGTIFLKVEWIGSHFKGSTTCFGRTLLKFSLFPLLLLSSLFGKSRQFVAFLDISSACFTTILPEFQAQTLKLSQVNSSQNRYPPSLSIFLSHTNIFIISILHQPIILLNVKNLVTQIVFFNAFNREVKISFQNNQ